MSHNMFTPRKCGKSPDTCCLNAQHCAQLAFSDTRSVFHYSLAKAGQRFGVSVNTIKRWESGEHPVNPWRLEADKLFRDEFRRRFDELMTALDSKRAA